MRTILATLAVALSIVTTGAAPAEAAPATVSVRVEGRSETLFEGPIVTDGRNVRAASDTKAPPGGRRCNGLNNEQNPTPGPTPTAATVDAMNLLGEDFDGRWYAEPFEDYFIERWGPDAEDESAGEYWGVIVNHVVTSVGGCQYQLDGGDEVLWAYDAFRGRSRLGLYPAAYPGDAVTLTASVQLGEPFEVEVDAWDPSGEGEPPAAPQRGSAGPFEGAAVAPVVEGPGGFEAVDAEDAGAELTDEEGLAEISFGVTGWHRIKAVAVGAGGNEIAIRSNRLDVCVYEVAPSECPPVPADDQVRIPPPPEEGEPEEPGEEQPPAGGGQGGGVGQGAPPAQSPSVADARAVRLRLLPLDRSRLGGGVVKASWRILDPGPGVAKWSVSSLALGRKGARYVGRASGDAGGTATLRLPRGAAYRLRLTVTDVLGRAAVARLGTVRVPR
jgi:uncharacterized protein DUF4430